ncbi:MAG TPA: hypothetical protein VJ044_17365 [Candidatus Hodarchaeales archaeon]|nr:hypothetical protein [Candidatus Hodarchaeales archaeon]
MVDIQTVVEQVQSVFGEVKLPLRISILDRDGLEVYTSNTSSELETGSTDVLGISALEELSKNLKSRETEVHELIIRTSMKEFFIAPVAPGFFLSAVSGIGQMATIQTFLDGLLAQIRFVLKSIQ